VAPPHAGAESTLAGQLPIGSPLSERVASTVERFSAWLDRYGETSYDFQTFYAGPYGKFAKGLYYQRRGPGICAVAPIIFCEAFVPAARRFFFIRQRFPIADAHYAMGFARLAQRSGDARHLQRAVHFLEVLLNTSCRGESGLGWGYPFDWVTIDGTIHSQTPLITTLPYVYEAFSAVHAIAPDDRWLHVMHSIAEHALHDYRNIDAGNGTATCTYTPLPWDRGRVVNANAYRAFLLTKAAHDLKDQRYVNAAESNLQFVLTSQNADGSWFYAIDGRRDFIDHFHTCFVLKALLKIVRLTSREDCDRAIQAGLRYYADHLFCAEGLPRPFAKPPRLIVYRRELYDYAECINLLTLAAGRQAGLEAILARTIEDAIDRWQRPEGQFRSRQLLVGWDDVPMHRWAQAQLFRSLCGLVPYSPKQERRT
jgi:hypothetical protein